jgi:hypothetical protein
LSKSRSAAPGWQGAEERAWLAVDIVSRAGKSRVALDRGLCERVYDNAYLVLTGYATGQAKGSNKKAGPEREAAEELLTLLRGYAHPGEA